MQFKNIPNIPYLQISSIVCITTFLFGLFTTFEVFKTELGGITILYGDFFYLLFIGFTLVCFVYSRTTLNLNKYLYQLFCIFFLLVLSTLNFLPSILDSSFDNPLMDGSTNAIKYVVRNLFQLIIYILICFLPSSIQNKIIKYFCYGFLTAIVIHATYSIIQMFFMYTMLEDIHTQILGYLGITKETIKHDLVNFIGYPIIRNCGFHWDPAYFGLWGCIGFSTMLYTKPKNILLKIFIWIIGISWLFSFSRSGYFAFICGVIICSIGFMCNDTISKPNFLKLLNIGIVIFIFLISIFLLLPDELKGYIKESFIYRFTYDPDSEGTSRHLLYPLYAVEGSLNDIFHFIFGYGPRNSSRGIAYGGNILDLTTIDVYDIESDLCKMLLSYGIIGFTLYLLFNLYIVKYYIKFINYKINSIISYFYLFGIICSFFAGIFYMYNDSKWIWYMYIFALLHLNNTIHSINFQKYGKCFNNYSKL